MKRWMLRMPDPIDERIRKMAEELGLPLSHVVLGLVYEALPSWEKMTRFLVKNPDVLEAWKYNKLLPGGVEGLAKTQEEE